MTTTTTSSGHAIASFEDLIDLANERLGGAAIYCSDDFFAGMENLVKAKEAVWDEHAYTDRGKWMDGWESKRSHDENHGNAHEDFCIVRLGAPGIVRGVVVDTAFFRGNYPAFASLEGAVVDGYPTGKDIAERAEWFPLLDKVALQGNAKNSFALTLPAAASTRVTHVRLRIYPDGGVARLRVYGEPLPDWRIHGGLDGELEISSAELGGVVIACSDMFFGSRHNLLFPDKSGGMHDGWETRRARRPGYDWAVVKLAAKARPARVVVDTSHFKGNCPESFALDGAIAYEGDKTDWREIVSRVVLQPHTKHVFVPPPIPVGVSHVRLRVFPDGGVARFRLFGKLDDEERSAQRVRRINAMTANEAQGAFLSCCGSAKYAQTLAAARPFANAAALEQASERAFASLGESDWLDAFKAHPRIGGKLSSSKGAEGSATSTSKTWSGLEQSGMSAADDALKAKMAALNDEYFAKHGFIYIVMATGKSAQEMLDILQKRVGNDRDTELKNAAAEQRKITALRLQRVQ